MVVKLRHPGVEGPQSEEWIGRVQKLRVWKLDIRGWHCSLDKMS